MAAVGLASAAVFTGSLPSEEPTTGPTVIAEPDVLVTTEPPAEPTTQPVASDARTPTPTPEQTPSPEATQTSDDQVAAVQQQLADLGYYVGAIDGAAGPATASAVQAFQKVQGLTADGVIGPNTIAALESPRVPSLRGGPGNRVEVDLDRQVMYLVQNGDLARIFPISSGSGETYTQPGGGTARSVTPVGSFTVERNIRGVRNAPLGTLYDPMYFHGGWAIHGSNSVPSYPASHGCVRVTRADAQWLFDRIPVGTAVEIYGNTNAFSPALGETAGTNTPAGDTPETTPADGIQTEEPVPEPSQATEPTESSAPEPVTPAPVAPEPSPVTPPAREPTTPPAPEPPAPTTPSASPSTPPEPSTPGTPTEESASDVPAPQVEPAPAEGGADVQGPDTATVPGPD